jgi:hypothetical protein
VAFIEGEGPRLDALNDPETLKTLAHKSVALRQSRTYFVKEYRVNVAGN